MPHHSSVYFARRVQVQRKRALSRLPTSLMHQHYDASPYCNSQEHIVMMLPGRWKPHWLLIVWTTHRISVSWIPLMWRRLHVECAKSHQLQLLDSKVPVFRAYFSVTLTHTI